MTETPGNISVQELLNEVHEGNYVIPFFQRGFEWQPRMVCDLVQSIIQDYFTGLLLLWNLDPEQAKNEEWDPIWGASLKGTPDKAILDGQQRLSSLYFALYNPKKKFPNRSSYYVFTINLFSILDEDFDETADYDYYRYYRPWDQLKANRDEWIESGDIPLNILSAKDPDDNTQSYLDSREFERWLIDFVDQNEDRLPQGISSHRVYQTIKTVLNYNFVFYPLRSDRELRDICNIFARVNEKGMKLSTFDLMNAFLYPKGVKLRKELWEGLDYDLLKRFDSGMAEYLLKLISLKKQNYCSSKYLYNLIPGEKTTQKREDGTKKEVVLIDSGEEFVESWDKAAKHADKAREVIMNTGTADFGAIKTDYVPNSTILPVLGALFWEFKDSIDDSQFKQYLKKWYWSAVFSEDYSGSSDSVMAKDYRDWKSWFTDSDPIERISKVNKEFIFEMDLSTVQKGSARYNAILCLLALNKAPDFFKGRQAGSGDYADSRINDHHIFPSGVNGLDPKVATNFSESKDKIVNRTLLFDETNNRIKNKKPSVYLEEVIEKVGSKEKTQNLLQKHLINKTAFDYLLNDRFDDFISERERTIKNHIATKLNLL